VALTLTPFGQKWWQ